MEKIGNLMILSKEELVNRIIDLEFRIKTIQKDHKADYREDLIFIRNQFTERLKFIKESISSKSREDFRIICARLGIPHKENL